MSRTGEIVISLQGQVQRAAERNFEIFPQARPGPQNATYVQKR